MANRAGRVRNLHQPLHGAAAAMQRLVVTDGAAQIGGPTADRVCHVCQRERARYTCPRCESPYCGIACYKDHGANCTEGFFRDQVIGELKNERPDHDEREKVASLLAEDAAARAADAEMLDPDANRSELALEEAAAFLAREDLSDDDRVAKALGVLTKEQQQAFLRAVSAGQPSAGSTSLRPWVPWWNLQPASFIRQSSPDATQPSPLITEILEPEPEPQPGTQSQPDSSSDTKAGLAAGLTPGNSDPPPLPQQKLPALSTMLRGTPSPSLSAHMVDLLYAYVYCKQLYNGDWGAGSAVDSADVAQCALQLSVVLTDPAVAAATIIAGADAVNSALQRSLAPNVFDSAKFSVDALEGVICILRLGHGPMRAMHDLYTLFKLAAEYTSQTESSTEGQAVSAKRDKISKKVRKQLISAVRKLWFFIVWCADTGGEDGSCLDWLQVAASVVEQSQLLRASATTGEELRAHVSTIRPNISVAAADAKTNSEPGALNKDAKSSLRASQVGSDTARSGGQQHQAMPPSTIDSCSPEQEASLAAKHKRQSMLSSRLASSDNLHSEQSPDVDGSEDRGGEVLLVEEQASAKPIATASMVPTLSPNQLVSKLWPAQGANNRHGGSKLTQDHPEARPEPPHETPTQEDAESATAPNPWRAKRERRAKKTNAAAAAMFRPGQSKES